ncbi:LuxR C-terminal-related transcriptional regulator [Amycolatopsis alkalitolerans]|nr:LuxR C-terminal-related transcriptional regulator [Amycolatopsis alkalitolerans]
MPDTSKPAPVVTSVCAPAGYGKTTLLSGWTDKLGSRVGWVRIDESDNDPATLRRTILAAVRAAAGYRPVPSEPPRQRGAEWTLVSALAEVLHDQDSPVLLMVDDAHRLHAPEAVGVLEQVVQWLPSSLRLVVSGRRELALGLHRMRVAGQLSEIRTADLALRPGEVERALTDAGVRLDEDGVENVAALTAGWPCAVRLVALALIRAGADTGPLDRVVMADPAVRDYLEGEVLAELSERERAILAGMCVWDEFTADAAANLTGCPDVGASLESFERAGDIVFPTGNGTTYRVHPFIRSYLHAALRRRQPAVLASLHAAAARWSLTRGDIVAAAKHSVHGGDLELLAEVVRAHGPSLVLRGETALLLELAAKLPETAVARPGIALVLALGEMASGDRASAELRLAGMAGAGDDEHDTSLRDLRVIVRTHWARLTGRLLPEMTELDERLGRMHTVDLTVLGLVNRGTAALWLARYEAAERDLGLARRLGERHGYDLAVLHCLSHLAGVAAAGGDLVRTARLTEQALGFARQHNETLRVPCCYAYTLGGWAAYQAAEVDKARSYSARALELLGPGNDRTVRLGAQAVAAIVDFDHGDDPYAACVRLRRLWTEVAPDEPVQLALAAHAVSIEQRMALRVGRPGWAAEAERRAAMWLGESGEVELLRVRRLWHQGRMTAVRSHLQKITEGELGCLAVTTRIEAHLLATLLAYRAGDEQRAETALRAAVATAGPRRMIRPFCDVGAELRELLVVRQGRFGRLDPFVAGVVAALPAGRPAEPELTAREAQLLRELPSLATVEEIAATLYVSANTVKTHLRNVYRKLGATSRREAIVVARRRGLL